MITTMNTCEYPEIKFISFLIFSRYQLRIKKFIKIKTFSYLPTQIFSGGYQKHTYYIFRPKYNVQQNSKQRQQQMLQRAKLTTENTGKKLEDKYLRDNWDVIWHCD